MWKTFWFKVYFQLFLYFVITDNNLNRSIWKKNSGLITLSFVRRTDMFHITQKDNKMLQKLQRDKKFHTENSSSCFVVRNGLLAFLFLLVAGLDHWSHPKPHKNRERAKKLALL